MARVHIKVKSKVDPTGLRLLGRNRDGRYQYRSVSVMRQPNVVNLTHEQRVGLAVVRQLLVDEFGRYFVYPMTRNGGSAIGYGEIGMKRMWIVRYQLAWIGKRFLTKQDALQSWRDGLWSTVIHEAGHNAQPIGTKPHGPEFKRAEMKADIRVQARLRKHGWPKIDMRKLRESKVPV